MRAKLFFIIFSLFIVIIGHAQAPVPITKVTKDSISIKWLPNNFEQFKLLLTEKITVKKVALNESKELEEIDFTGGSQFNLSNGKENYIKYEKEEWFQDSYELLLSPYFDEDKLEEGIKNYAFALSLVANLSEPDFQFICGNIFIDKDFDKKKKYAYEITAGKEKFRILIDPNQITKYTSVDFNLTLDKKKTIDIEWKSKNYNQEFFGFHVEKAITNKNDFKPINKEPYLPFRSEFEKKGTDDFIRDDSLVQGEFHFYRISGIDLFGKKQPSDIIKKIYVPKLTNAWIQIDTVEAKDYIRVIKGVVHPLDGVDQINLNTIQLLRSNIPDGDFEILKEITYDKNDTLFTINAEVVKRTGDAYYYKVIAFNKDKDTVFSLPHYFFTLDQEPPNPVKYLTGTIDSLGIVDLSWEAPEDKDIIGYRVYRANDKHEEFIEKTTRLNLNLDYRDTLSLDNLTSEIYYYVIVVDSNYNNSVHSDTLLLIKPDTIPPIPNIISFAKRRDSVVHISWINSTSSDVKNHALIRSSDDKINIDTLYRWNDSTSTFKDYKAIIGNFNSYQIITWDNSNNSSISNSFRMFFEPGYRKKIPLNIEVNRIENYISIRWDKPNDKVFSYQLYKGKSKESLTLIKTIEDPSVNSFFDIEISINNQYFYAIKYINSEGIHSMPNIKSIVY